MDYGIKTVYNNGYVNTGFGAQPKGWCVFMKSAKSFDLALKIKKIKQNKKFWLNA